MLCACIFNRGNYWVGKINPCNTFEGCCTTGGNNNGKEEEHLRILEIMQEPAGAGAECSAVVIIADGYRQRGK